MSSIEQLPKRDDSNDLRPIGRFLLSRQASEEQGRAPADIYTYAQKFASDYKDLLDNPWTSNAITRQEVEGKKYWLEFQSDVFGEDYYMWRLFDGRMQYETYANDTNVLGVAYEFTNQGQVLRRQLFQRAELLGRVQTAVEYMTGTTEFYKDVAKKRRDLLDTLEKIEELREIKRRNFGQQRDLESLESQYLKGGFSVGSKSRYEANPLIHPSDRLPARRDAASATRGEKLMPRNSKPLPLSTSL